MKNKTLEKVCKVIDFFFNLDLMDTYKEARIGREIEMEYFGRIISRKEIEQKHYIKDSKFYNFITKKLELKNIPERLKTNISVRYA